MKGVSLKITSLKKIPGCGVTTKCGFVGELCPCFWMCVTVEVSFKVAYGLKLCAVNYTTSHYL